MKRRLFLMMSLALAGCAVVAPRNIICTMLIKKDEQNIKENK